MTKFVGTALLVALAAGCTSTATPSADDADAKYTCRTLDNESTLIEEVLAKVNEVRAANKLEPLVIDPLLSAVADDFACEMITDRFLAHTNPTDEVSPGERLTTAGYIYYAMGENLAAGQASADEVVADWLASDAHRANILSPEWREVGIAVREGGEHGWYWVQEFADPVEFAGR
ncbi:MAG: CAP domain-containing protein [Phycisphaerales bacterium]|nr:CAP domain-containing protein [Phycisphaerales bacterium]